MSKAELAQLCVLLGRAEIFKTLDINDEAYNLTYEKCFDAGVKACEGNAVEFFKLCDLARGRVV